MKRRQRIRTLSAALFLLLAFGEGPLPKVKPDGQARTS